MKMTSPRKNAALFSFVALLFASRANANDLPSTADALEGEKTSSPWVQGGTMNAESLFQEEMRNLRSTNQIVAATTAATGAGLFVAGALLNEKGFGAGAGRLLLHTGAGYFTGVAVGSLLYTALPVPESRAHAKSHGTTLLITGSTLGALGLGGVCFGATRVGRSDGEEMATGFLIGGGAVLGIGTSLILNGIFEKNAAVRFGPWATNTSGGATMFGTF